MCNLGCTRKERAKNKQTNKKRDKKGQRSASAVQQTSSKKKKIFLKDKQCIDECMCVYVSKIEKRTKTIYEKICVCKYTQKYD